LSVKTKGMYIILAYDILVSAVIFQPEVLTWHLSSIYTSCVNLRRVGGKNITSWRWKTMCALRCLHNDCKLR
jgi:hypothetical protein